MNQVAETILAQLGGRKFQVMTGAKYFLGGADYLQFKLPSNFVISRAWIESWSKCISWI